MELNLHPIATKCFVSGRDFAENDRVVSYLVRLSAGSGSGGEGIGSVVRYDLLEAEDPPAQLDAAGGRAMTLRPEGPEPVEWAFVYCRWVVAFKQRKAEENPALTLKLTAENLFLTLANPEPGERAHAITDPNSVNTPLLQFLALMLERKKLIKPRGLTENGLSRIYEHMPSHQLYEVPVGDLNVEFFQKIREHLDVLVGIPKPKAEQPAPTPVPVAP